MPLLMRSRPPHKFRIVIVYELILQPMEGKQGVYQRWGRAEFYRVVLDFGVQLINGKWVYKFNPPEKYPEQSITLI